jgi:hypothetical protein
MAGVTAIVQPGGSKRCYSMLSSQVDFAKWGAKIFCERIPEFAKRGD